MSRFAKVDHARLATWAEKQKKIFTAAAAKAQQEGGITGGLIAEAGDHADCLSQLIQMIGEHAEMVNGRRFDAGDELMARSGKTRSKFRAHPVLYKPDGSVIELSRKEPRHG